MHQSLLSAENAVASIAQAGDDIAVVVELFIQSGTVDVHVGMIVLHALDAFGRGDDVHQLDVLDLVVLDELNGSGGRALSLIHICWRGAVVFRSYP